MGATLLVPAIFQGELVAILALGPKREEELFTSEDLELVATLADQAAIAIQHGRAYQGLSQLKEGLENEVARRTEELTQANEELRGALDELKETQTHLFQSKKLASLGELVRAWPTS